MSSTAMSRVMGVPELLELIAHDDELTRSEKNAMSQVCRLFWEPAMRALWSSLAGVGAFHCLFGDALVVVRGPGSYSLGEIRGLAKPFGSDAVTRCLRYSKFVKQFSVKLTEVHCQFLTALQAVVAPGRIFPNMDDLSVDIPSGDIAASPFPLLLTGRIRVLEVSPTRGEMSEAYAGHLLDIVGALCPAVESVTFHDWSPRRGILSMATTIGDKTATMINRCDNLRSVHLHFPAKPPILLALRGLAKLEELYLHIDKESPNLWDQEPAAEITVRSLTLGGYFKSIFSVLERHFLAHRIVSLKLLEGDRDDAVDLGYLSRLGNLQEFSLRASLTPFTWEILRPILSCSKLKRVFVTVRPLPDFGSQAVLEMARAWPNLRVIQIDWDELSDTPPPVSLRDFECFARLCPQLEELDFQVDTSRDIDRDANSTVIPHPGVKCLGLTNSTLSNSRVHQLNVAHLIDDMWPNLTELNTFWEWDAITDSSREVVQDARWNRVRSMIHTQTWLDDIENDDGDGGNEGDNSEESGSHSDRSEDFEGQDPYLEGNDAAYDTLED